jgi:predicted NBD/HSP70 family sugar kinase
MPKSESSKTADSTEALELPAHGASVLPSVTVDSYNLEVEDEEGFVGDKASKGAFWKLVEKWRQPLRDLGQDPFGDKATDEISKKQLAEALTEGDPEAAGLVQSAIEDFAQQLAFVIRRFLRLKDWRDTECITIGGGFRGSRVGELAIARAALLLNADEKSVDIEMIRNDPDEAGLLGAAHLLPAWMLKGHDGILAVDIGGTNIRAGIIELNIDKAKDLSKEKILTSEIWRHADEETDREGAVAKLVEMLSDLSSWAKKNKVELAPIIGIGCPGIIEADGFIDRGGQNLPGNWESKRFNLARAIREDMPKIGEAETLVVMHNDAVVQGLSEMPYMQARKHWGVLTIGTGLGNARYTNRVVSKKPAKSKS